MPTRAGRRSRHRCAGQDWPIVWGLLSPGGVACICQGGAKPGVAAMLLLLCRHLVTAMIFHSDHSHYERSANTMLATVIFSNTVWTFWDVMLLFFVFGPLLMLWFFCMFDVF